MEAHVIFKLRLVMFAKADAMVSEVMLEGDTVVAFVKVRNGMPRRFWSVLSIDECLKSIVVRVVEFVRLLLKASRVRIVVGLRYSSHAVFQGAFLLDLLEEAGTTLEEVCLPFRVILSSAPGSMNTSINSSTLFSACMRLVNWKP